MPLLEAIDEEEFTDRYAYLTVLAKSADCGTRERALDGLADLDRMAAAGLVKVGPKGYVHGWLKVGGPGNVGDVVHHPEHGRGRVTRVGSKTSGVQFDSGAYHAFEHTPRTEHHGADHFVERATTRKPRAPKAPATAPAAASMDEHLGRAHTAMSEGRHADAVNHLTAAANAAPDKPTRDRITAARDALGAKLTGIKPKTPRKTAAPRKAPAGKPASVDERIRAAYHDVADPDIERGFVGSEALRHHPTLSDVSPKDYDAAVERLRNEPGSHVVQVGNRGRMMRLALPAEATRRAALKKPTVDPAATVAALRQAKSRDEARQIVAQHTKTKADLQAVMDHAGVAYGKGWPKKRLQDQLVEWLAGRRIDADVIGRVPLDTY